MIDNNILVASDDEILAASGVASYDFSASIADPVVVGNTNEA